MSRAVERFFSQYLSTRLWKLCKSRRTREFSLQFTGSCSIHSMILKTGWPSRFSSGKYTRCVFGSTATVCACGKRSSPISSKVRFASLKNFDLIRIPRPHTNALFRDQTPGHPGLCQRINGGPIASSSSPRPLICYSFAGHKGEPIFNIQRDTVRIIQPNERSARGDFQAQRVDGDQLVFLVYRHIHAVGCTIVDAVARATPKAMLVTRVLLVVSMTASALPCSSETNKR